MIVWRFGDGGLRGWNVFGFRVWSGDSWGSGRCSATGVFLLLLLGLHTRGKVQHILRIIDWVDR